MDVNGDLHDRKAGNPNGPSNDPKVMNTDLYFDPIYFASHIKAPVLAAIGFIDTTFPPAGIFTALNQISVDKEPLPMIESEHNDLTPQKEQNWHDRSEEILGTIPMPACQSAHSACIGDRFLSGTHFQPPLL